jgi:hypothetical protein
METNELCSIIEQKNNISAQMVALADDKTYSKDDRTILQLYYQERLTELSQREQSLIDNIEVEGAIEIPPFSG